MLEMLLDDKFSQTAEDKYRGWTAESRPLCVPSLFYSEVTSAIRSRVYRRMLVPSDAPLLLDEAIGWSLTIWDDVRSIQESALEFATRFNRPKAYDAQYLALADLLGCDLWTADRRLVNAVGGKLPWVRWLGEGA
jgi:predicted nucleic acid-binding protein